MARKKKAETEDVKSVPEPLPEEVATATSSASSALTSSVSSGRDFVVPRVVVGFHSYGAVHPRFSYSLARACAYEGNKIAGVIPVIGPLLEDCRNRVIENFLVSYPEADYLLMVDADVEFPSDAIGKSLFIMRYFAHDVLYGNYALGDGRNSIFVRSANSELFTMIEVTGDQTYLGIGGGGTGWLLASREVLTKMQETYPKPFVWFGRDIVSDEKGDLVALGEDLTFGRRVGALGFKQMGTSQIALLHYKERPIIPKAMIDLVGAQHPGAEFMSARQ